MRAPCYILALLVAAAFGMPLPAKKALLAEGGAMEHADAHGRELKYHDESDYGPGGKAAGDVVMAEEVYVPPIPPGLYGDALKVASIGGDPETSYNGTTTRFNLPDGELVPVLEQPPLTVSYRVSNPFDAAQHIGADWITEVGVALDGAPAKYVNISLVNPATLQRPDLTCEPPLPGAPLSTMRVSVGGKPLMAGLHAFQPMMIKATFDRKMKRIGCGYVEHVDITTADFHVRFTSAPAKKFAKPEMQVKGLHLDVELFKLDKAAVRGVLPELWGLAPLSAATTKMLSPQ